MAEEISPDSTKLAQITTEVLDLLREEAGANEPVLLAKIGARLSTRLGQPLKSILGSTRLSDVIRTSLGETVRFEGAGSTLRVSIDDTGAGTRPVRYDTVFWAAFSKPLADQHRRFITPRRPFHFMDIQADHEAPEGRVEIEADLVPDVALSKPERDARISEAIQTWCTKNNLLPRDFIRKVPADHEKSLVKELHRDNTELGTAAIAAIAAAIPVEERGRYSLPLDLVCRLLSL